ncbi:MAG TPA: dUTP diphosphatase [Myxococcota bacterium]|nr:dUTP diphosphatase [Myxococcota bacterium]HQK50831.1 dUTP diphosphatase [Myxococcota bacterium]
MSGDPLPRLRVLRLSRRQPPLPLPRYATAGSSGLDLASDEDLDLQPGQRALVATGFAVAVPPGLELQVRPRSGLAARHGVTVLNAPGTVDSDYRGEVKVVLVNLGQDPFPVRRGDRIAQAVLCPVVRAEVEEVPDLDPTDRDAGGFGSTGR